MLISHPHKSERDGDSRGRESRLKLPNELSNEKQRFGTEYKKLGSGGNTNNLLYVATRSEKGQLYPTDASHSNMSEYGTD